MGRFKTNLERLKKQLDRKDTAEAQEFSSREVKTKGVKLKPKPMRAHVQIRQKKG